MTTIVANSTRETTYRGLDCYSDERAAIQLEAVVENRIPRSKVRPCAARGEFRWAIVRLILGQLQMVGATVGFLLLLTKGVDDAVFRVVAVTTLATVVSKLLFRKLDRCEGRDGI